MSSSTNFSCLSHGSHEPLSTNPVPLSPSLQRQSLARLALFGYGFGFGKETMGFTAGGSEESFDAELLRKCMAPFTRPRASSPVDSKGY